MPLQAPALAFTSSPQEHAKRAPSRVMRTVPPVKNVSSLHLGLYVSFGATSVMSATSWLRDARSDLHPSCSRHENSVESTIPCDRVIMPHGSFVPRGSLPHAIAKRQAT